MTMMEKKYYFNDDDDDKDDDDDDKDVMARGLSVFEPQVLAGNVKAWVTIPTDTWITPTQMPIHQNRNEKPKTLKNCHEILKYKTL